MNKQEMIKNLRDLADWNEESGNIEDSSILKEILDTLQLEPNPIQDIVKLNEERYGLDFDAEKAYMKLHEEMKELEVASNEENEQEMLDALLKIFNISLFEIYKLLNGNLDELYKKLNKNIET